jgi:hypothetical protein
MAALVAYVAVRDDDGIVHSFGPGSDVPDWAKPKITNPKVWEGGGDEDADEDPAGGGDQKKAAPVPPPKGGKGSGEDKWREYAAEVGVDVSEAQDRDDIITILELAEVPTE